MACQCGSDRVAVMMTPSRGMVKKCADCGTAIAKDAEPEPEPAPRPVAKASPVAKTLPLSDKPLTRRGILAQAKAEARSLRRSIAAHERALKTERRKLEELDRLLDAASNKRLAVVRSISTTATKGH